MIWQGGWYAQRGIAAASIDILSHGERAHVDGSRPDYGLIIDSIVAEWRAALDILLASSEFDPSRVGYRGMSIAAEPRIVAAELGAARFGIAPGFFTAMETRLPNDAPMVKCAVLFGMGWDDELVSREGAFALFDALGTRDKQLRACVGGEGHGSAYPLPAGWTEAGMQFLVDRLVRSGDS